jgi:hypothetical protein
MTPDGLPGDGSLLEPCAARATAHAARVKTTANTPAPVPHRRIGGYGKRLAITGNVRARTSRTASVDSSEAAPAGLLATAGCGIALLLLFIAVSSDGAFAVREWAPLAIFALLALAFAPHRRLGGASLALVIVAWAYAVWSGLSVLWADSPGSALEGAGRNLGYAALVSLPLLTLRDRRWPARLGGGVTIGLGVITAATLVAALGDTGTFLAGRLNDPVGYRNGTAALFALAFWPLLCAAARRDAQPLLRAAALGAATAALGLAFLTQSRGVLIGFACGGVVAVALGPDRLRRAWLTLLAVAGIAAASGALLAPYHAFIATTTTSPPAVHHALTALLELSAGACAVGLALALVDGGLRVSARATKVLRRAAAWALAALTVTALVAGLAVAGNPVTLLRDKAREFTQLDAAAPGETRLGSTGGQRYDLWRVAWNEFRARPLTGVGEGSYAAGYYRERRTNRNLSTPHSLIAGALAETGLVGLLALLAIPFAGGVALVRAWPAAGAPARRTASALAAAAAVLFGQATVDWLWLLPGLTGLGLVCLGLAVAAVALPEPGAAQPAPRRLWQLPAVALPVVASLLVGALYFSDLEVREARAARGVSAATQLGRARDARRLDPVALPPRYLEAGALESLGRRNAARNVLFGALHLEPTSFVTMALLGDLELRAGHPRRAQTWYRRALARNPGDVGLQQLARG